MSFFHTPSGRLRPMLRLGLFVVFLLLTLIAIELLTRALGLPDWIEDDVVQPIPQLIIAVLVLLAVLGLLTLHLQHFEKRALATIGLPLSPPWEKSLAVGLAIGACNIFFFVIIMLATGNAQTAQTNISLLTILQQTLPVFIALAALSGWEEIVLRGYSLQMLAEAFGPRLAAIITGIVFGMLHVGNPGSNLDGLAYTALGGILLGWLVIRTGSLWLAWGYHAGWNITAASIFGLRLSGVEHPGSFLQTQIMGADWLSGGDYGFEGSVLIAAIEIISLAAVLAFASYLPGHRNLIGYFTGSQEKETDDDVH